MNYDTIILEMLSRIQKLEETVASLTQAQKDMPVMEQGNEPDAKVTTADIRKYISEIRRKAAENGEAYLVIKANAIHKALRLRSRLPMVCNAMRQSMGAKDEIVFQTPSGYSSTFEVKYDLSDWRDAE